VTGLTLAYDFPTSNPFQQACITCGSVPGGIDSFFAKITFAPTPDFLLSVAGSSLTTNVVAGASAQFTLNLTPENGFNHQVSLTCAGAPPASTCAISPTVTLNGSSVSTAMLTLNTTARSDSQRNLRPVRPVVNLQTPILIFVLALLCSLVVSRLSLRKRAPVGLLLLLLCVVFTAGGGAGCGGGSEGGSGGSSGTPVGDFIITVTGSAGGVTHGTAIQVFIE
jgi:hypothetical protein